MKQFLLVATVGLLWVSPASAENRYSLAETKGGTIRLDRKTGTVSFCRKVGGGIACSMAADERSTMIAAIEEMAARIDALERRVARFETTDADKTENPAQRNLEQETQPSIEPEEERQIDKAMRITETLMRRLIAMVQELKEDFQTN